MRVRGLVIASLLGSATLFSPLRPAHAEPAPDRSPAPTPAPVKERPSLAGFEILGSVGYGTATGNIRNLELEPYGVGFALDFGYVFRKGFRVGGNVGYGLGQSVEQRHDTALGQDFDFTSDASSLNVAVSLGYDVPLYVFTLRYALNLGASFMRWGLDGAPADSVLGSGAWKSPTAGFLLVPGVTLLWPHGAFECGVGFDYFVQTSGKIPPGLLGEVLVGVKL